jgi:hypothetical protein
MAAPHKILLAELAIYDASIRLEKSIVMLADLRALIQPRLPIAEAEAEMDDTEDLIDQLQSKLGTALAIHEAEVERLQPADDMANDNYPAGEAA